MLCFVHIERAGGTTLHYILRNNYLSFLTLTPSLWSNDPASVFTASDLRTLTRCLPFTRGFGGHNTRVYTDYESVAGRPIRYVTFLREPIARYRSHFQYQVMAMGVPWTIGSFLDEPRFANFMTVRIAGEQDVERAKELLRDRFAFVGLTERFDASLLLMARALGLRGFDLRYERQNVGRGRGEVASPASATIDPELEAELRARNHLDLELYRYARDVLYPAQVARYGETLDDDVAKLRRDCQGFQFSRPRRYAWGTYRKLVYQPIERSIHHAHTPHAQVAAR
jgi:Galactose-3-O-sulfotransferase